MIHPDISNCFPEITVFLLGVFFDRFTFYNGCVLRQLEWRAAEKSFTKCPNCLLFLPKFSLKLYNFFHKRRTNCGNTLYEGLVCKAL